MAEHAVKPVDLAKLGADGDVVDRRNGAMVAHRDVGKVAGNDRRQLVRGADENVVKLLRPGAVELDRDVEPGPVGRAAGVGREGGASTAATATATAVTAAPRRFDIIGVNDVRQVDADDAARRVRHVDVQVEHVRNPARHR